MELNNNETIIWQGRSSWKALYAFYLRWVLISILPLIVGLAGAMWTGWDVPWPVLVLLTLLGLTITLIATWFKRAYSIYTITTHRLNITRGLLGKDRQNCRLDRIQNANCKQTLIQRILDVGTLEFETAGDDEGNFYFYSITRPNHMIAIVENNMEDRHQDSWQGQPKQQ